MFRKNSIFVKVFLPVFIVMLIQTSVISIVLFANGTIDSLSDSAVESLYKNAENRSITLESMMISYWANLDKLEENVTSAMDGYLDEAGVPLEEVWGQPEHEKGILSAASHSLIDTLRVNASTGVFMYFLSPGGYTESPQSQHGLYYRDLAPLSSSTGNSDLLFLRGFIDIARKDKIQLDSLWNESFSFDPQYEYAWQSYSKPQQAAEAFPSAQPVDLAYWSPPHYINPWSELDTYECVTYTRPLFYQGRPVAIIGTEMQTTQLERLFPASDFDNYGKSGYMLVRYDGASAVDPESDMLIAPGENGIIYSMKLNSNYDEDAGTVSVRRQGKVSGCLQPPAYL